MYVVLSVVRIPYVLLDCNLIQLRGECRKVIFSLCKLLFTMSNMVEDGDRKCLEVVEA